MNFLLAIFAMVLSFGIIMLGIFFGQWVIFWILNKFCSINIPIIFRVIISVAITYLVYFVYFRR